MVVSNEVPIVYIRTPAPPPTIASLSEVIKLHVYDVYKTCGFITYTTLLVVSSEQEM